MEPPVRDGPPRASQRLGTSTPPAPALPPPCLNCGAPLTGAYCAQCGQEVVDLAAPSWVVVRDALGEALDVDGRLLRTARALLRPGELTAEYRRGRRAPYVGPLKLFLVAGAVLSTVWVATRGVDERFYHLERYQGAAAYIEAVTRGLLAGGAAVAGGSWLLARGRRRFVDEAVFALHAVGTLALFASLVILLGTGYKLLWGTVERVPGWLPWLPLLLFAPASLAGLGWFVAAVRRVQRVPWWWAAVQGVLLIVLAAAAVNLVLFSSLR